MRDCVTDKTRLSGSNDVLRIIGLQIGLTMAGAFLVRWRFGEHAMHSVLFGGGIAISNSLVSWVVARNAGPVTAGSVLGQLYGVAALRLLLALLLFAIAFGVLNLGVLPVIGMFAVDQIAYGWVMARSASGRNE
jgi:F0F1-type ATP synthase assembly protein I